MTMTTGWYRDALSCLQVTLAVILQHAGHDPLETLGLGFEFRYLPGDVRPEEFYWPARFPQDLARSVLPHLEVSSRWRAAEGPEPLAALAAALDAGRLPIVAVDNFYLPFRPAYGDVHAAHLLVVTGIDESRNTVDVADHVPPAFTGAIGIPQLMASWRSEYPPDVQDVFFSGTGASARWLDVHVCAEPAKLDEAALRRAIEANVAAFADTAGTIGFAGLRLFAAQLAERAAAGDGEALAEAYTFGWSMQAQAALHGELLRRCGMAWGLPALAEAGRLVERVAHAWSGIRVTAGHGRSRPEDWAVQLGCHAARLEASYAIAVDFLRGWVAIG